MAPWFRTHCHGFSIASARRGLRCLGIGIFALICLPCCLSSTAISEQKIVIVTAQDADRIVEIAMGDTIQIELAGTATTGFWWHFTSLDNNYLELVKKDTREIARRDLEGAPIMGIWQVRAKQAGKTAIEMAYYRSWEGMAKAQKWFHLFVQIR